MRSCDQILVNLALYDVTYHKIKFYMDLIKKPDFFEGVVLVQVLSLNKQQFWLFVIIETFVVLLDKIIYDMLFS